jgi:uncharacterized NAD(P)/FAD-binding protein YdhS
MDALRPHTQLLWQELAPGDKRRFLRHLRSWWEIHRHRMPPSVAAQVAAARERGALQVMSGRLEQIELTDDGLLAIWRPRRQDAVKRLPVQRVINCSGPETDCERIGDPLVAQLIEAGLARPDPYRLGLHATGQGALSAAMAGRRGSSAWVRSSAGRCGRSFRCPKSGPRRNRWRSRPWLQPAGRHLPLGLERRQGEAAKAIKSL